MPLTTDSVLLGSSDVWNRSTMFGDLDIAFLPAGTTGYDELAVAAARYELEGGVIAPVASLADVIRSKRAAGRPKIWTPFRSSRRSASTGCPAAEPARRCPDEVQQRADVNRVRDGDSWPVVAKMRNAKCRPTTGVDELDPRIYWTMSAEIPLTRRVI